VDTPAQVRQLTTGLQQAAREAGLPPLLIGVDQEGGQLMAVDAGATPLPGNMALGAAGDPELARRAGEVLGRELAAIGINVNYAPSCDVNINPQNPVIGTRSFGEDTRMVSILGAAMVEGIQSAGVAATAKHFPGHGDTASDSHHGIPQVPHARDRLDRVELPPFQAAIQAGVKLVMTAHLGLPAITGRPDLPATLSENIMSGLLRHEMGFAGVVVTDAMDMHAIPQGDGLGEAAVCAAEAGCDLLLLTTDPASHRLASESLQLAVRSGRLDPGRVAASSQRILALKQWLVEQSAPDLSVVGCAAHRSVAEEIARRSITLVRDQANLLPLPLADGEPLTVILPRPLDLTPADTSSYVAPALAQALRTFHHPVHEIIVPHAPQEQDIAAVLEQLRDSRTVLVGTINAYAQPGQAALVRAVLKTGLPTVVAALRMPYDLAAFPEAPTYLCTYSLLEPSMHALANVIFGRVQPAGRLPVSIPGLYPLGHGLP
jgi:beta-N-acetylhexosaminidase